MGPIELQLVSDFIALLERRPLETMQAVQLRLSTSDFELRLLHADPLKEFENGWEKDHKPFPINAGERSISW